MAFYACVPAASFCVVVAEGRVSRPAAEFVLLDQLVQVMFSQFVDQYIDLRYPRKIFNSRVVVLVTVDMEESFVDRELRVKQAETSDLVVVSATVEDPMNIFFG